MNIPARPPPGLVPTLTQVVPLPEWVNPAPMEAVPAPTPAPISAPVPPPPADIPLRDVQPGTAAPLDAHAVELAVQRAAQAMQQRVKDLLHHLAIEQQRLNLHAQNEVQQIAQRTLQEMLEQLQRESPGKP